MRERKLSNVLLTFLPACACGAEEKGVAVLCVCYLPTAYLTCL